MAFFSPVGDARVGSEPDAQVASLWVAEVAPVMAVYRGTVISVGHDQQGYMLTLQHDKNF